jgi:murein DD-endopeptidase MepM/ murein hydrolase activator NlpD
MAQNARVASLQRELVRYPRLDPRAVQAVASREGLGGGVGDAGTSFGPFQLHAGGALPGGLSNPQSWAWSPEGIRYALDAINKVGGGLKGRAAIEAIVRRFERPANPGGEIADALGAYGGQLAASTSGPQRFAGNLAPTAPDRRRGLLLALSSSFDKPGLPDVSPYLSEPAPAPAAGSLVSSLTGEPAPRRGGLVAPLTGKLIGRPYQGTHGKAFNERGGSANWESENAVDIADPVGTPVRAVADGVIGQQFGSLGEGGRFAGLRLHLQTPGDEFYYAHLSRFAPGIRPGTRVRKGQVIGYSGKANGVGHLHFAEEHGNPTAYS